MQNGSLHLLPHTRGEIQGYECLLLLLSISKVNSATQCVKYELSVLELVRQKTVTPWWAQGEQCAVSQQIWGGTPKKRSARDSGNPLSMVKYRAALIALVLEKLRRESAKLGIKRASIKSRKILHSQSLTRHSVTSQSDLSEAAEVSRQHAEWASENQGSQIKALHCLTHLKTKITFHRL